MTLRKMGLTVAITSMVGNGFVDILASYDKKSYLIEIKNGKLPPSAQKLTLMEQKFHNEWQDDVVILNSVENAINWVNEIRKRNANK